ncbi:methionyl-tRNA formyltransferase [Candidatus Woesearchaeota archaeon]|nr:methionyl-tRNA formyltransferase [Candidatus Woesearchaeota archaeon]
MNVIWLSANKLGYELLKEAVKIKEVNIMGIVTLDKDASTVMYDAVPEKVWSQFGIPIHKIKRLNEEKELITKLSPDLIIMCGWRQIVDKEIINLPKEGFIGFHPTLLPIGRGPAPIINTLLNEFKESGLTMFYVTEGLDNGDIIGQEKFVIYEEDHAQEVYNKVILAGRKLIQKYLPLLIKGKAQRNLQDESKATFFEKLSLKDNEIDLNKESLEIIYKKIRAFSKPYKGAYIKRNGKKLIIWSAELIETDGAK